MQITALNIEKFEENALYYREPFRLKFLDQASRQRLKNYTNDPAPVKYVSTTITDLELILFYSWNNTLKSLSDISKDFTSAHSPNLIKNKLIFLLASTNSVASDFSSLNFMSGLFLGESYYIDYNKISSRSFDAIRTNGIFGVFCSYPPRTLNKKVIRHSVFYISKGEYRKFNQLKFYNFTNVPKIQKDSKAFSNYFTYMRPFFRIFHPQRYLLTPSFSLPIPLILLNLLVFSIIFSAALFYFSFINYSFLASIHAFFFKIYNADLQHRFIYLGFTWVDLEFINLYLSDLTPDKFFKDCKYVCWSLFWGVKVVLLCRLNTWITIPFFRTVVGPIGLEIRSAYPEAYDNLFDHWWF